MNDTTNDEGLRQELRELCALVGNLSENHKGVLDRHEQILLEAFQAAQTHATAITDLRAAIQQQNENIAALHEQVLTILRALSLPVDPPAPPPIN
jgi:uncharacterized protein (DUF3084 family)